MLDSKTVYSGREKGATIRELIRLMKDDDRRNNVHSIEHVIPKKQYIIEALEGKLGEKVINGATVNPLNFLPCHARVNTLRNVRLFDLEGDVVASETLRQVDGESRRFEGGRDAEGEWVPPIVSRGDVARCVMYMELRYKLGYVKDTTELLVLQKWMKEDEPSEFEIQYGLWLRETMPLGEQNGVQNPFVLYPELATNDELFDLLVNAILGMSIPRNAADGGTSSDGSAGHSEESSVTIDSVLPNPRGIDAAGAEIVTLRNSDGDKAIHLTGWILEIVVHYDDRKDKKRTYDCSDVVLHSGERLDVPFSDDNVLPNSRKTTVNLLAPSGKIASSFTYKSNAARPGKILSRT